MVELHAAELDLTAIDSVMWYSEQLNEAREHIADALETLVIGGECFGIPVP